MIKSVTCSVCLIFLWASVPSLQAQPSVTDVAIDTAVQMRALTLEMRQKLAEGQQAEAQGDLARAAKLYQDAWDKAQRIGPSAVEVEAIVARLVPVRLQLARDAQRRNDYKEADTQLRLVLRLDPNNPAALALKAENDKLLRAQEGRIPSADVVAQFPNIRSNKVQAATFAQNGRVLFEADKLDDAEVELKKALALDPDNQMAFSYMSLVHERRFARADRNRELVAKAALVEVEKAWQRPIQRETTLPVPNPYARSTAIHTGKGRQNILSKLERIYLNEVKYPGIDLSEVIKNLGDEAKKRDPDRVGINFIISAESVPSGIPTAVPGAIDPATGLPITSAFPPPGSEFGGEDVGTVKVKIDPALNDVRLADVLDAIVKTASRPIKYSVEDYAIVFSAKATNPELVTRRFKVDPNTFYQGLESVVSIPFGAVSSTSGGGGGGGGRGGGGGGGDQETGTALPRVEIAPGGSAGGRGGGGGGGGGIRFVTQTNELGMVQAAVKAFFKSAGVDLAEPKAVFFNERQGTLFVRATAEDLDIIEEAVQALNVAPPQVNIKTRFAEVTQNDIRALGFDWYLGNTILDGSSGIIGQGGTAPSYTGVPTRANPLGFFPGTDLANTIPSSASDQLVTSGLRNAVNAPAVGTLTGILTDPQFRVVIRALEQRDGVDLISAPEVTTQSGRQAQVQVVDIVTIVTGTDVNQNAGGGGGTAATGTTGTGVVGSTINYPTASLPFGPVLDVIPYVSADGYTIQMTIIPTITEFVGYDDPGQFVPQAQSVSGGQGGVGLPIRAQLPLPHFRMRQVTTSASVWDGQTIVLGGLISEDVTRLKDKVPVLGDLPLVGKLFRSESSSTRKKNLMIFVTPTIIDPAGNRYHSDEEMPFRLNTFPPQARSGL